MQNACSAVSGLVRGRKVVMHMLISLRSGIATSEFHVGTCCDVNVA